MSFVVQKNCLHPLKGIAAKLQKRDLDIYEAYQRVDETVSCLQSYRTNVDEFHSRCYAEVVLCIIQANTIHANNVGDINIETGLGYYANIHLLRSSSIRGAVRSDMII